jgi:hypothetical protein
MVGARAKMKTPIWAKTEDGKWERFPFELLEQFEDGTQGFSWCVMRNGSVWNDRDQRFLAWGKFGGSFLAPTISPKSWGFDMAVAKVILNED